MYDRCSLLGWSVRVLLLRLASFGATSRSLSRLRWRRGLKLSCGGRRCALGQVGRTGRSGTTIDSRVRTFIGVNFANGRIVRDKLLVHESVVRTPISTRGLGDRKKETADSRLRSSRVSCRFGRGDWPSSARS